MTNKKDLLSPASDALPVATWRHHPLHDQHTARLVAATLADQALFNCDLVKLTPASTWQLIDHGLADTWEGNPIGRRRILRPVIQHPDDWDRLRPLDPGGGFRARIVAAAGELRRRVPAEIPVVATVFNPLFVAIGLAGLDAFEAHRHEAPERVAAGLRALQDDGLQVLEALADTGVDGIFLAVQHANAALWCAEGYAERALDSDCALLEAIQRRFRVSMLHLHGAGVHLGLFQQLPISFLHYDMAEPGNPPPETIVRPTGCGISTGPPPALFAAGNPAALSRWVHDLAQRMAGRPFLLAPGCAVPLAAPEAMHLALVATARELAGEVKPQAPVVLPIDHGGPVNKPFTPFPAPETLLSVLDRFRWVVERHSDRLALIDGCRCWTYAALLERVEALAEALLGRLGDGEEPVAVLLPQDARAPLALLAVLAAGRTPVPLDPAFPLERNRRILEHAEAVLVIGDLTTHETESSQLPLAMAWLLLDAEGWAAGAGGGDTQAESLAEAEARRPLRGSDPAWLLFTSGSTGEPKGVIQNQRGLLHDVMQYTNAIHLGPEDRLTQLYSASVSGALRDIYGALLNGACLYPLSVVELGVAGVLEVIRRERLTVLHAIPGIFRLLIENFAPGELLPDVRMLYLAGDRVDRADVEAFRAHFPPHCLLYLGIGSTENSTLYSHHFLGRDTPMADGPVPVGRQLPDRALLLLGDDGAPVPLGAIGEIECTSRYLAQGYWRDPETTARRFLPIPGDASIRRFRSGDLARLGADGLLRFLGRRDNQIKIAGRRVEAAEVEAALLLVPGVERALVMSVPDGGGEMVLVAWLQGGGTACSPRPGLAELQASLRQHLPQGLVPARFLWLEAWPLTANGKVDRRALLAQITQAPTEAPAEAAADTPQTEWQRQLQSIWTEVLGHSAFGMRESFFLVGGHSFGAVRVLSRLHQRFGVHLPLSLLLEHPTITSLEELLLSRGARPRSDRAEALGDPCLVPLQTQGEGTPLFVIHGVGGDVFFASDFALAFDPVRPVYGLQALGIEDSHLRHRSVEEMAEHYAGLIERQWPEGEVHLLGYSSGGWYAWAVASALLRRGRTIGMLGILDSGASAAIGFRLRITLVLLQSLRRLPLHLRQLHNQKRPSEKLTYLRQRTVFLLKHLRILPMRRLRDPGSLGHGGAIQGKGLFDAPTQADLERDYFLQMVRAYRPSPQLVRVSLFTSQESIWLKLRLWRAFACGGIEYRQLFQEHSHFQQPKHAAALAQAINEVLEQRECGGMEGRRT